MSSCVRAPIKNRDQALRATAQWPALDDDLEFTSLIKGLEDCVRRLKESPPTVVKFGPREIETARYIQALEELLAAAREDTRGDRFRALLREKFEPYEIYGRKAWGEVFMTSYYEPVIEGSRRSSSRFRRAIYGVPKDLVDIDLGSFLEARPSLQALRGMILEQRSQSATLRGRLLASKDGAPPKITAYLTRAEIADLGLKDLAPALAWVDPIDAFFLEIQGSGIVRLEDGSEIVVGYAAQNGHPYVAIGKFLIDSIPKEKLSIQTIEAHLRSLPEAEAQTFMNRNPSFVFFRQLKRGGQTFLGTDLVTGRTIATDQAFFPKGTLAFLEFERPVFASPKDAEPASWQKTRRFVLDQDTGGAIRGPDRLDLYWGRGAEARQSAGVMKNLGRLIYFVPKP